MEDAQLEAIGLVVDIAGRLGVDVWLRGGWAMDFYLGEVTRSHVDVDWFAYAADLPGLVAALLAAGWTDLAEHPAAQQVDLARGDVELGFAAVELVGVSGGLDTPTTSTPGGGGRPVVAGGPWAGSPWPAGMLADAVVGRIGAVSAMVISPAAQVEIKRMMPTWGPGLAVRAKDLADIELLERRLRP